MDIDPRSAHAAFILTTHLDVHDPTAESAWMDAEPDEQPVVSWAWTGQSGIAVGDLIAIYVANPESAICWLGRAISPAEANPHRTRALKRAEYWFWLEMTPLRNPVTLAEMKRDPRLKHWGPVVQNFQSRSRRVEVSEGWEALISTVVDKNPEVKDVLDDWQAASPETFVDPDMGTYTWSPGIGSPFPFLVERDMQTALHEAYVAGEGFSEPRDMSPPLDLPSFEPILAKDARADLLFGLPAADGEPAGWALWETKLLANADAVRQLARYADLLNARRPGERIYPRVIAHAFSRQALALAMEERVACWRVRWATDDEALKANAMPWLSSDGSLVDRSVDEDGNSLRFYPVMLERLTEQGVPADDEPAQMLMSYEVVELPDDET